MKSEDFYNQLDDHFRGVENANDAKLIAEAESLLLEMEIEEDMYDKQTTSWWGKLMWKLFIVIMSILMCVNLYGTLFLWKQQNNSDCPCGLEEIQGLVAGGRNELMEMNGEHNVTSQQPQNSNSLQIKLISNETSDVTSTTQQLVNEKQHKLDKTNQQIDGQNNHVKARVRTIKDD
ncbi:hypothetical protein M3Y94_00224500 [Aphelenchoides besseyi]|nr:hypothetical protein M3Y94_00224500 [Aphelenchoides besseyi]KAI6236500.1 hypothetical protein M3Y95_00164300 [Aphelenchoides besseyi]